LATFEDLVRIYTGLKRFTNIEYHLTHKQPGEHTGRSLIRIAYGSKVFYLLNKNIGITRKNTSIAAKIRRVRITLNLWYISLNP